MLCMIRARSANGPWGQHHDPDTDAAWAERRISAARRQQHELQPQGQSRRNGKSTVETREPSFQARESTRQGPTAFDFTQVQTWFASRPQVQARFPSCIQCAPEEAPQLPSEFVCPSACLTRPGSQGMRACVQVSHTCSVDAVLCGAPTPPLPYLTPHLAARAFGRVGLDLLPLCILLCLPYIA